MVQGRVVALLLSLCLTFPLFAADDAWLATPLTGDPKALVAAAEKVDAGESPVTVLFDESRYVFDDQGRSVTTERRIFRIVEEAAVEYWSTVSAGWAPWYQERPLIQARVITKDGTVHMLDPKAITEAPAAEESLDIFSDNRVIRAPLPAVAVGSVVEQVITYHQKAAFFEAGTTDVYTVGNYVPMQRARVVIDAPLSLPLELVNTSDAKQVREEKDGRQRIVFEGGPYKAYEDFEWNLPYDVSALPYIALATGKSWQEIATRYSAIVEEQIAASAIEKMAREAIGNAKERREVVARALAYIQKRVRYAGVEVGESSIVPRTPQAVLQNRYGDCKDKATLLVAILRYAGIPASVALLRAGEDFDTIRDLPGLGMFNHAIVVVDGEPQLWVDPTDEFARAGELPAMDQGRLALIANPKTTELTLTPASESTANRTTETRLFTLTEEGKSGVREITEATGPSESSLRRFYATSDRKSTRESLEEYAKAHYVAKSLADLKLSDLHDLAVPFRLELDIVEATRGLTGGGEAVVAIFPANLLSDLPWALQNWVEPDDDDQKAKEKDRRKHDFVFARPYVKEWIYRVPPPPGYAARTLPQDETTKLGSATMTRTYATEKDGTIVASFRFDTGKRRLTPSEFETLRKAISELENQEAVILGFDQIGQAKLNTGDIAGALAEFRRLIKLHPKEGRHQADLARALLIAGMGEAAREQARRAIALEPSYAGAHRMLGIILQYDLFGRAFRKGCDIPGAVTAYRKAKELDPKDIDIRAELALLLEMGDDALRFSRNADLAGAIAEYRKLIDEDDKDQYEENLLLALAMARRFDELKELAKTTTDSGRRDLANIVAIAATGDTKEAIRLAGANELATRKQLLSNAASYLMTLRMYERAADLLDAASKDAPSMEKRAQIENIRKARLHEDMTFPDDNPESIVRQFLLDSILGRRSAKDIVGVFSADVQAVLLRDPKKFETDLASSKAKLSAMARQQGMPIDFYADAGLSLMQFQREGSDATGYRMRMRGTTTATADQTFYVVRDNGQYKIGALQVEPWMIGFSVLRLLDAKQPEIARQWLNWAREDISSVGGDDPFAGAAFPRLWAKSTASASEEEMRLAAASLMTDRELAERSIPIFLAARDTLTGEKQQRVDQLLSTTYMASEKWSEALAPAQRALAAHPDSESAFSAVQTVLANLGRAGEIPKLAQERLERMPKDDAAMRAFAYAAMHLGNYAESEKYLRQVIKEMTPSAGDYNDIAWNALLSGTNLEQALEDARQATNRSSSPAVLHTIASIYAEIGNSLEARQALLNAMDQAGREEPASSDWYVLGRIAENYGATEAALAAYKRVEKPKESTDRASTYQLAERRMKSLAKK